MTSTWVRPSEGLPINDDIVLLQINSTEDDSEQKYIHAFVLGSCDTRSGEWIIDVPEADEEGHVPGVEVEAWQPIPDALEPEEFSGIEKRLLDIAQYLMELSHRAGLAVSVSTNMVNTERPFSVIGVLEPGDKPDRYCTQAYADTVKPGFFRDITITRRYRNDTV